MKFGLTSRPTTVTFLQVVISIATAGVSASAMPLPRGSYVSSCRHIYVDGPFLQAFCARVDGEWNYTRIFMPHCTSDHISNQDGHLSCGG